MHIAHTLLPILDTGDWLMVSALNARFMLGNGRPMGKLEVSRMQKIFLLKQKRRKSISTLPLKEIISSMRGIILTGSNRTTKLKPMMRLLIRIGVMNSKNLNIT